MAGVSDTRQSKYEMCKEFSKKMSPRTLDKGRTGIFPIDSPMAKHLMQQTDDLKLRGSIYATNGQYRKAIEYVSQALEAAVQVKDNCYLSTPLLHGRSCCFCQLGEYEKAYVDALLVFRMGTPFMGGPLQIARSSVGLERYAEALFWILSGLAMHGEELKHDMRLEYMELCLDTVPKVTSFENEHVRRAMDLLQETEYCGIDTSDIFGDSIRTIASYKNWKLVIILLKHPATRPLMMSYVPRAVDLSEILQTVGLSWVDWGEDLVIELLERGADHVTLCAQSKYPYHAALKKGLQTGCFRLLTYLYRRFSTAAHEARDDLGDTVHQTALRDTSPNKDEAVAVIYGATSSIETRVQETDLLPVSDRSPSVTDAHVWLEKSGLGRYKDKFQRSDGPLLMELKVMQQTAPKAFFRVLGSLLHMTAAEILTFSEVIRTFSSNPHIEASIKELP